MNNNNNIILTDSLETLHHRVWLTKLTTKGGFSLSLSWKTYKNKGGMKGNKNGRKMAWNILSRASEKDFPCTGCLFSFTSLFLCFLGFVVDKETNVSFSFYMLHQLIGQSELSCALSTTLVLSALLQLNQVVAR